jgi:ELWxxDGT repeat protein
MGETLFFFAYDAGGYGLWRTDGSPSGTSRVRSLPGAAFGDHLIAVNGDRILFAVTDPDAIDAPSQLWRSDGTAEGTIPIRRFATDGPGLCPLSCEPLGLTSLTPFGDFVLFVADDGEHGLELWRSDGTVEGTAIVADLTPGTQGSYFDFSHFVEAGGLVYFASPASGDVLELWATDGTASGTRMVPGVPQGRSAVAGPFPLAAVGNRLLYFYPGALYSTDGTEGGSLRLLDLGPIQGAASLAGFAALPDGSVLFTRNSLSETSLWKTDGTPAGTFLVPLDGRHAVLPSDPSPRAPRTIGSRD